MKLHPNGTIEGTPEELHQYTKLQEKKEQFKVIPPTKISPTLLLIPRSARESDEEYEAKVNSANKILNSQQDESITSIYARCLLSAIANKGNLH